MSLEKRLQTLYDQVPKFECKEGCTDCCGPVPFSLTEWSKIKVKKKATCLDCPYSLNGSCEIYKDRPLICRLFGAVDDPLLTCPHGCAPEKKLTQAQSSALMNEYDSIRVDEQKEELNSLRTHRKGKA